MKSGSRYIAIIIVFSLLAGFGILHAYAESGPKTYVIFTVDTERDFPPILNTYKGMDEGIPILLDIFDQYDIKATFLVTGHVAKMRPDTVKLISEEHEIGNHSLYHLEPLYTLDYDEKIRRIEESTSILEGITGKEVTSFRAPGHSCDSELLEILQDHGYLVEASAYKGDSYPYHPSTDDWTKIGDMEILRVPVSNAPHYFYSFFYYGQTWVDAYEYVIAEQEEKGDKIVVVGMHPWELVDIDLGEGNELTERVCGEVTYNMLIELLEYLKDKDVEYITLSQSYEIFS